MSHKSTVTLDDTAYDAWKASRVPLAELIRRGLEGTGDTARHTATESRLAAIEARVAQLEAARTRTVVHAAEPGLGTGDQDDAFNAAFDGNREPSFADEPPTPEEEEAKLEADQLRRAQAWARVLRTRITPDTAGILTVAVGDAVAAWRINDATARTRLRILRGCGLAQLLEDEVPQRWIIPGQPADADEDAE